MGVRPPGFEVFCIGECGSTSNVLFCVREVWQDFILVVVRLSRKLRPTKIKTHEDLRPPMLVFVVRKLRPPDFVNYRNYWLHNIYIYERLASFLRRCFASWVDGCLNVLL